MNVVVIGGGESGVGAALLAKKKGYKVFLSDNGKINPAYLEELINNNIPFEEKGHTIERLFLANVVIKSPGVPEDAKPLRILRNKGLEIISEIEFGYRHYGGKVIAVSGSNGKTTTSGLLYHIMKSGKMDVMLGGNIGTSFCRLLAEGLECEYAVLELSSFQLDNIVTFSPEISVLLNITPDHLDRYNNDIELYAQAKANIFRNQKGDQLFIYNADDATIKKMIKKIPLSMKVHGILEKDYNEGIYSKELDSLFEINLIGKHNLFNACCAITVCRTVGLDDHIIDLGLKTFTNVPHRLETVSVIDGVTYINDSKATNVDSVYYALDGIDNNIIWIAGGTDKGNDYHPLFPLVAKKVKALICIGVDNNKLIESFRPYLITIETTQDIVEAVEMAENLAEPEDVVLLSPACASFDLFKNYEDRGEQFKDAVWKLIN